ncbi:MAG: hypothetical protein HN348_05580 [Proteobacteria bacterium]|jgi:pyruvate ferredoxin oxidoreductase gamma subunit|nr:hypothetical protein [Pseudomonadota bacterium]
MARDMFEIRLVGRGGQGVVTAGDLLGKAALLEGKWAQSIPTFGPERRGALSMSTLRISQNEIMLKCTTARPDVLLVLDPTIWHYANVVMGLQKEAVLVFNTPKTPQEVNQKLLGQSFGFGTPGYKLYTVDATSIAIQALGRAITNTAMMGAFVGATGLLEMPSIEKALQERFGAKAAANFESARLAREALTTLEG